MTPAHDFAQVKVYISDWTFELRKREHSYAPYAEGFENGLDIIGVGTSARHRCT